MSRPLHDKEARIGDRVSRPVDVMEPSYGVKWGTVANVRYDVPPGPIALGPNYSELIDVQWDNEEPLSVGYFPHGLHTAKP